MDQTLKTLLIEKMQKALVILERELSGLRTGRASINLLDSVIVDAYGSKMPVSQVGTVSTPDAKTISVQVWDKGLIKAVEKGIIEANLGLSPVVDGQTVRMAIPPLNEERRKEMVKIAYKCGENSKITLRNIRRDGMDELKQMEKRKDISEDDLRKYSDQVQKLTDEYISKIDDLVNQKEKDILTI